MERRQSTAGKHSFADQRRRLEQMGHGGDSKVERDGQLRPQGDVGLRLRFHSGRWLVCGVLPGGSAEASGKVRSCCS